MLEKIIKEQLQERDLEKFKAALKVANKKCYNKCEHPQKDKPLNIRGLSID
jgi:hypothetical protein